MVDHGECIEGGERIVGIHIDKSQIGIRVGSRWSVGERLVDSIDHDQRIDGCDSTVCVNVFGKHEVVEGIAGHHGSVFEVFEDQPAIGRTSLGAVKLAVGLGRSHGRTLLVETALDGALCAVNRCFVDPIVWSGLVGDGELSKLPVVPVNILGEN